MNKLSEYTLRKPKPEEAGQLTQLVLESKRHWGYPEEYIKLWTPELTISPEFLGKCIGYVAERDNQVVGLWCREPVEQLTHGFYFILPDHIGKGLGRILWNAMMKDASDAGLSSMTWLSDPNAQAFYEHMGAQKIGEQESPSIPGRFLPIMRCQVPGNRGGSI